MTNAEAFKRLFKGLYATELWSFQEEKFLEWLNSDYIGSALLSAQEPMKPVLDIDEWKCGNCGHTLEHQQLLGDNVLFHEQYNYCPECGKAVKWNV